MSVLAQEEVLERLSSGDLVVSPILDKTQIGRVSIDLRLGTVACMVRGSDVPVVDPKDYVAAAAAGGHAGEQSRRRKLDRISVPFGSALTLHAGSLILASTFEWVKLPFDLQGLVTARSSWAREGLSIATATFINPCYSGIITLELENFGQTPIVIYPGMRLAQLALYQIDPNRALPCAPDARGQFDLSFEPTAGDITKGDLPFIPDRLVGE
jgi:dCTP deaminase